MSEVKEKTTKLTNELILAYLDSIWVTIENLKEI
jgi:hypothetical protein